MPAPAPWVSPTQPSDSACISSASLAHVSRQKCRFESRKKIVLEQSSAVFDRPENGVKYDLAPEEDCMSVQVWFVARRRIIHLRIFARPRKHSNTNHDLDNDACSAHIFRAVGSSSSDDGGTLLQCISTCRRKTPSYQPIGFCPNAYTRKMEDQCSEKRLKAFGRRKFTDDCKTRACDYN